MRRTRVITYLSTFLVLHLCGAASAAKSLAPLIRLVDGKDACEGRVEIRLHAGGVWGTVCDDLWRESNADVACQEMGYSTAISPVRRSFGRGKGPILMDDVVCRGRERSIRACRYSASHNCNHKEDVGVRCSGCVPGSRHKNESLVKIVHGGWSKWSTWSQCTVTCGGGRKARERLCNNPAPQNGGSKCIGKSIQSRKCAKRRCASRNWSRWTEWSSCSATCGNGTQERYRRCTTKQSRCKGPDAAKRRCVMPPCSNTVCNTSPCENNATCVPEPGGGFQCICRLGFFGATCQYKCGCRKTTVRSKIVVTIGTRESGSWPWNALLKVKSKPNYICSATLIHPEWLLTTSHCVKDAFRYSATIDPAEFKAVFNLENRCRDGHDDSLAVREIIMHPKFRISPNQHRYDYDIALLRLRSPSKEAPACLPEGDCEAAYSGGGTKKCFVIGWGKTSERAQTPSCQLLRVNLPIERTGKCNSSNFHNGSLTDRMFCAGRRGKDACSGDSGSQFSCPKADGQVCPNGREAFQICGMVSWGIGCGRLNKPGVYTRVDHFVPWIKEQVYSRQPAGDPMQSSTDLEQ
eukprot:m.309288 g.309288  ORF g.309288 m.309288 type:complete len:577 (+) comp45997_c0_seq1:262-1992(+)